MKKMMILLVSISVVACASQKTVEGNEKLIGGSGGYLKYVDLQAPRMPATNKPLKKVSLAAICLRGMIG